MKKTILAAVVVSALVLAACGGESKKEKYREVPLDTVNQSIDVDSAKGGHWIYDNP